MKFLRITILAVVIAALAVAASPEEQQPEKNELQEFLNEAGEKIHFFETGGDEDGEDDDEDDDKDETKRALVNRRSRKHHHGRNKHSHKSRNGKKKVSVPTSSGPDSGSQLLCPKTKVTWYASQDLKNPQCGDGSWSPTSSSHIGAVMAGWSGGPSCGEFVQLCNDQKSGNPCVRVRIVDKCAGCSQDWVDLTQSAFKKLAKTGTLDEGEVHNLKMYRTNKPTSWDKALFGPIKLKA